MKKLIFSLVFIGVGSGFYWLLSKTTYFSFHQWDTRIDSMLVGVLHMTGFKNEDVLSSLNVLTKDNEGQWITKQLTLRMKDIKKINEIKNEMEKTGAEVLETTEDGLPTLLVKRGSRVYQEIRFKK